MELSSSKLTPLLATLGAAALALFVGINNLAEIHALQQAPQIKTQEAPEPSPTLSARSDLNEIASWHLFGQKEQAQPVAPAPAIKRTEAPKTRLKLSLQGIFSPSIEGEEGWAIIEAPKEGQKAYRVGDEIPGGAILSSVEADQVILTRNNRPESLPLEQPTDTGVALDSDMYMDLELELEESMVEETMVEEPLMEEPMMTDPAEINPTPARGQNQAVAPSSPAIRPRQRARIIDPDAPAPDNETIQKSPAMEAVEQGLIEEMEKLRSRFPKQ